QPIRCGESPDEPFWSGPDALSSTSPKPMTDPLQVSRPFARRILSGMRPTGRLHLGNFVGALENWVQLQDAGWHNYHMVADWHMLTTGHEDTSRLQSDIDDMVLDWLGAGLDPQRIVIFIQSEVKEHA